MQNKIIYNLQAVRCVSFHLVCRRPFHLPSRGASTKRRHHVAVSVCHFFFLFFLFCTCIYAHTEMRNTHRKCMKQFPFGAKIYSMWWRTDGVFFLPVYWFDIFFFFFGWKRNYTREINSLSHSLSGWWLLYTTTTCVCVFLDSLWRIIYKHKHTTLCAADNTTTGNAHTLLCMCLWRLRFFCSFFFWS